MLKQILLPFSLLWRLIVGVRNSLYDLNILRSKKFGKPFTIGIGNLSLGGSGKSPHVTFIAEALKDRYTVALLSRGYGRKTKGFRLASEKDSFREIGDEPAMYKRMFPDLKVAVSEKRVEGITRLMKSDPDLEVVILDDVYQHRQLQPSINILITDFASPFYKDKLLPAGRLREPVSGKKRADVIVVSKTPEDVTSSAKNEVIARIEPAEKQLVFFSGIAYCPLRSAWSKGTAPAKGDLVLLTGIVNPAPLRQHLGSKYNIVKHFAFRDHHTFSKKDLKMVKEYFNNIAAPEKLIVTTEKDLSRLVPELRSELQDLPLYVLPIKVSMEEKDKETFINHIVSRIHG